MSKSFHILQLTADTVSIFGFFFDHLYGRSICVSAATGLFYFKPLKQEKRLTLIIN